MKGFHTLNLNGSTTLTSLECVCINEGYHCNDLCIECSMSYVTCHPTIVVNCRLSGLWIHANISLIDSVGELFQVDRRTQDHSNHRIVSIRPFSCFIELNIFGHIHMHGY